MIATESTGTGPALSLLHGVGTNRGIWRPTTEFLAREHFVVAADLPGFGESPPVGEGFDLEQVSDALAEGLAEEAGGPFDLIGNSLGGAIALVLALRRPDLVRRLVLSAPAGFSPMPDPIARAAGLIGSAVIAGRRVLGEQLADNPTGRQILLWGSIGDPSAISAEDTRMMVNASNGATRIGAAIEAVAAADLRPRVAELKVPVGLIWGESDRVIPIRTLDTIRELLPDAPVETLPGAGHVAQMEQPQLYAEALERLLQRL